MRDAGGVEARSHMLTEIVLKPIGTVHSPFKEPPGTPIQPGAAAGVQGMVEVFPEYGEGLKDLEGFSHLILLYYFHLAPGFSLLVKPFLDDQKRGLFATRAPARPNPIGISTVRLERIDGTRLYIREVDIVDGTPLLDIKPYVDRFDRRDGATSGWLAENLDRLARRQRRRPVYGLSVFCSLLVAAGFSRRLHRLESLCYPWTGIG